jgi:hypothetical protein
MPETDRELLRLKPHAGRWQVCRSRNAGEGNFMRSVAAALTLALALTFAVVPGGAAQAQTAPAAPRTPDELGFLKKPMLFYVARGEPDSCGPGCNEWIAAEGSFDLGAATRFRAFVAKTRATKLPVYIHSPGGLMERSFDIGRFIRERGMTVGVSRTLPEECKTLDDKGCNALKRSGKTLKAELNPLGACASACVYVLAAGKVRQVPPGARVGVHLGKAVLFYADGRVTIPAKTSQPKINASDARQRKYLHEMGVDPKLMDIASSVPHERLYILSRDEIASLGIDKREFQETAWMVSGDKTVSVQKLFVEARGPEHSEFRLGVVLLSCSNPGRTQLIYIRGLASNEGAKTQALGLVLDGKETPLIGGLSALSLASLDNGSTFDGWGSFNADEFLKRAEMAENFTIAARNVGLPMQTAGVTRLSTAGLSQAMATLREKCAGAAGSSGATAPKP